MKKKIAFALATLLAVGVVATTASATGPVAELDGFPCVILDADGNPALAETSHVTWFASGKVYLRCEGTVVNDTGTRITYNFANTGLLCGAIFVVTQNWTNTIGYNGSSQLTCIGHANPNAANAAAGSAGVG